MPIIIWVNFCTIRHLEIKIRNKGPTSHFQKILFWVHPLFSLLWLTTFILLRAILKMHYHEHTALETSSEINMNALPCTLWPFTRVNGCFSGHVSIFFLHPCQLLTSVSNALSISAHKTQMRDSDFTITFPMCPS